MEQKKTGVYKNLITGGISAAIARTITNPIERVEILRQVENVDYKGLNMFQSVLKFYKTQGIAGLFKGNLASVVRIFPFSSIEFWSFEFYKNKIIRGRKERQNSLFYTLICGFLTGINAITLTFPLDVARTRIAVDTANSSVKESSLTNTLVNLWKSEGIRGLYKGYSVTFIGSMPFLAIKQTTFDYLKTHCMVPKYRNTLNVIYGSFSGVFGTVALYPTYMFKRVLQANNKKDFSLIAYSRDLLQRQGVRGFYQGMSMTLVKVIPYQGILFGCNEKLKELLQYEKY